MKNRGIRLVVCTIGLLVCGAVLFGIGLLWYRADETGAQTENTPITRHVVIHHAQRYTVYQWQYPPGVYHVSVPYSMGEGDSIDYIGEGGQGWAGACAWFQHRLQTPSTTPGTNAGADCSGYVSRVWGKPIEDWYCKWGTDGIRDVSTLVAYADRNDNLPRRMRMGDVFDDYVEQLPDNSKHVVLLYYFDPVTHEPYYFEESGESDNARLNYGGWNWLNTYYGWWDGTDGYRPYRYNQIRDDLYFPWLANNWGGWGWESTAFIRNNNTSLTNYVTQHTYYNPVGGDAGAHDTLTLLRSSDPLGSDLWELPTKEYTPNGFIGSGVAAAHTGTEALVFVKIPGTNGQIASYTGITPFSALGMASASTLYMPVFYTRYGTDRFSKIMVQNAGSAPTRVRAYYYGDNGSTCTSPDSPYLQPWGWTILEPYGSNPTGRSSRKPTCTTPIYGKEPSATSPWKRNWWASYELPKRIRRIDEAGTIECAAVRRRTLNQLGPQQQSVFTPL